MSFFNKVLSSVGIGAAKIDAIVDNPELAPGETLTGTVQLQGGKAEQSINKIELHVNCSYWVEVEVERDGETETETQERQCLLAKVKICDAFEIGAGEQHEIPFSLPLPDATPLSVGQSEVWLSSHLDIAMAIDKKDRDLLRVVAHPLQQAVFEAVESLGFQLEEAECEGAENHQFNGMPFVQEFEFTPRQGPYRGRLDELELVTYLRGDQLEVIFEIDRKARGFGGFFAEMLSRDESEVRLVVGYEDLDGLDETINDMLDAHS